MNRKDIIAMLPEIDGKTPKKAAEYFGFDIISRLGIEKVIGVLLDPETNTIIVTDEFYSANGLPKTRQDKPAVSQNLQIVSSDRSAYGFYAQCYQTSFKSLIRKP
jgi:hypothetical protein